MASRCRSCGRLVPREHVLAPPPEHLAELAPLMGDLLEVASEYDSFDTIPTTAVEFVRWADVDVQAAAGFRPGKRRSMLAGPKA